MLHIVRAPKSGTGWRLARHPRTAWPFARILLHTNWQVHWVADLYKAMLFLKEHSVPMMVCPRELPDATWSELLEAVHQSPKPPKRSPL